ncbi:Polynucleotide 5'-hydroxyl-kinase grc3 [Saxophila tyrrhenica]|uniref:Polynucleotide 5'-hydroxyl-kinase GRC3 n=1 Tax=Saxophila tyrrhenica TaxID=1690608 RepID=A0AAV9PHR3_9PEZI|nr:Polynucleotide 5'-hydroxyl-kinase grc3 [Saxophila tyrrhenica]
MAQKRKAQEAFGVGKAPLSAFAAAKLARSKTASKTSNEENLNGNDETTTRSLDSAEAYIDPDRARLLASAHDEEDDVIPPPLPRLAPVQLSSFQPGPDNVTCDLDDCWSVALQCDETVTLVGECEIVVTRGVATTYGTVLRPGSIPTVDLFAPSTQALPVLQARQDGTEVCFNPTKNGPNARTKSGLRKLEKLSPLFRNIWGTGPKERSFAFLRSTADDELQRSLAVLEIDRDTDAVLRTLSAKTVQEPRRPRILTVGAKASGKSTFNRLLCNQLLSWTTLPCCQYLDIDPGQPEFGPPGVISLVEVSTPLLGPPFTHPASTLSPDWRLIRAHAIAATSFKDDPEHYKACVLDLVQHVEKKWPLIINTCGWVTGLGASVLTDLAEDLDISDIVLMDPIDSVLSEALQSSSPSAALHRIARRPPRPSSRTPAEQRAMQTMAYFHSRIGVESARTTWRSKPINRLRPWVVNYAETNPGFLAAMSYGQSPAPDFLCEVLDGSVVALNAVDDTLASDLEDRLERTPEGLPYLPPDDQGVSFPLPPSQSDWVGLALIRGIDTANKQLHLITPIPENHIEYLANRKVVLVRGGFDPPEWAYLEDLYKDDIGPGQVERPWVSRKALVGVEGAVWRLRHPPMAGAVMRT